MFIASDNLSKIPNITHGFFKRKNGVSKGMYASLNCGLGSNDNKEYVIKNRIKVAKELGADADKLLTLYQVHSADVVVVAKCWRHSKLPRADAMVTDKPGIALGILTADCVPVLFADKNNKVIGAAHAGWKGAFAGILEATIEAMTKLGAERSSIVAAIGPAIAQKSYEVDLVFYEKFINKSTENAKYFVPSTKEGHFLFNLKEFVKNTIAEAGIEDINMLENDTYAEEGDFFSYRRATHRGEADYGRQVSAIMLKP